MVSTVLARLESVVLAVNELRASHMACSFISTSNSDVGKIRKMWSEHPVPDLIQLCTGIYKILEDNIEVGYSSAVLPPPLLLISVVVPFEPKISSVD